MFLSVALGQLCDRNDDGQAPKQVSQVTGKWEVTFSCSQADSDDVVPKSASRKSAADDNEIPPERRAMKKLAACSGFVPILEEALSEAGRKPQNDQQEGRGSHGKS